MASAPGPERSRARIAATVALGVIAALLSLLPLGPRMVDLAAERQTTCMVEVTQRLDPDPDRCRQTALLAVPSVLPWTSDHTARTRHQIDREIALYALARSTSAMPDPDARASASASLRLAEAERPSTAAPIDVTGELLRCGAWSEAAASGEDDGALEGAILALELDRATALALKPAPREPEGWLKRGALLGLRGRREEAIEALLRADASARTGSPEARAALATLGAEREKIGFDPAQTPVARDLVTLLDVERNGPRSRLMPRPAEVARRNGFRRVPFAALQLAFAPGTVEQALATVAPGRGAEVDPLAPSLRLLTPDALFRPLRQTGELFAPPALSEQAASNLEGLAAVAGESAAPTPTLDRLTDGAAVLRLHAGWSAVRLGDCTAAQRNAQAALEARPALTVEASAILIACGRSEAVTQPLRSYLDRCARGPSGAGCVMPSNPAPPLATLQPARRARLVLAFALLDQRQASEAASVLSEALPHGSGTPADLELDRAILWTWAAATLLSHCHDDRPCVLPPLPTGLLEAPASLVELDPASLQVPLFWLRAAALPEAERQRLRLQAQPLTDLPNTALSAVVVVLGHGVGASERREVWLDRALSAAARAEPRVHRVARARAAAWRGDETTAQRWREAERQAREGATTVGLALLADDAGL